MRSKAFYALPRGYTRTPLYRSYHDMIDRCTLPTKSNFKHYGGRGIKVCDEWKDEYLTFYEWAIANGYQEGLQLDRIDNDGDYCPGNCRWADKVTQENNKRTNHRIEFNGENHTVTEWARIKGLRKGTILGRIKRGWSIEEVLNAPLGQRRTNAKP